MSSILTNNSAMVALQTMKTINNDLGKVQGQISTGLEVGSAKDNAAVFAISEVMKSDVAGFEAISDSLALGSSTVAVASSAAESIGDTLTEIKTKIVSAQESNVDRGKLDAEIKSLVDQVTSVVGAAQFNGLNLLDGSAGASLDILSSLDRDSAGAVTTGKINVDLSATNLDTATGGGLEALTTLDITTDDTSRAAALASIETMVNTVIDAQATFGTAESRIESQSDFLSKLTDSFTSGIGSLVDADMEDASAKLSALQVQQQLSTQALSIANSAPQQLLSLFR